MRYVILKRGNGRLELNGERDLRLGTQIDDLKVYKEFPREPKRPGGEPERKWPGNYGAKWEAAPAAQKEEAA